MQKLVIGFFVVACALGGYWVYRGGLSGPDEVPTPAWKQEGGGRLHFLKADLAEGIVGRSGEFQVTAQEVNRTAPMRSFLNRKRDVLFALVYKKFVTETTTPVKQLDFSFKKVSLSPSAILNKYGILEKPGVTVRFSQFPSSQGLAQVDGRLVQEQDLDLNNFLWAALQTEIFLYKLHAIDRQLKNQWITAESKKLQIRVQDYEERYIKSQLPAEISDKDIETFLSRYSIEDTPRNRVSARNNLLKKRYDRGRDYILERFGMDLPIRFDLPVPDFKLDTSESQWVPKKGDAGSLVMTFFGGTRNPAATHLLTEVKTLLEKFPDVQFHYRPFFSTTDRMAHLTAQLHFCVFIDQPENFWEFFFSSLGNFKNETEPQMYAIAKEVGLDEAALRQCVLAKKYQEVVDYHLQYASYLGITSGPVLYVGGEVLHGVFDVDKVESILQRKLQVPSAGIW
jgi:hypothetical protein